jgi:hypothetical protein
VRAKMEENGKRIFVVRFKELEDSSRKIIRKTVNTKKLSIAG